MDNCPSNLIQVNPVINPETGIPQTIGGVGTMTPPQIALAYNIPASDGAGIKIGIISLGGGFLQSDLDKSFTDLRTVGLISATTSTPVINQVLLDGQSGTFNAADGSSGENTVDIFCVASMVPAANITIYIGSLFESPINRAIEDGCHILTISWATLENTFLESILTTAATNKIAVCVASGDWGSSFPNETTLQPCYPSSSPQVISIGGTKLTLNVDNTRASESDDNRDPSFGSIYGGGGGVSTMFSLPQWQSRLYYTPITNGTQGAPTPLTMRGIPDISAPMNIYSLYFNGVAAGYGGTSLASPVIAGMLARMQKLTGIQRSSAEYNRLFYTNSNRFYDITVGTNNTQITSGYAGTTAWDPVTGLGPPSGASIYNLLRRIGSTFPIRNYGFRSVSGQLYPRPTTGVRR
jgi:kumamolisin